MKEGKSPQGKLYRTYCNRAVWIRSSVLTEELIDGSVNHDVKKYTDLMLEPVGGLLEPVGWGKERLKKSTGVRRRWQSN